MKTFYKNQKGITLIEIMVVIGILVVIISFGVIVDFSSFTSGTLQGEESKVVSLLERARSRAMANMYESVHGICYDQDENSYILFRDTCGGAFTESISANSNMTITFPDIIFEQLTGNIDSEETITITDGIKTEDIIINEQGTINW